MDQGPNIQLIDFHPFLHGSSEDRRNVASCIDEALQSAGFIYLRNHGIEQGKIDKCFTLSKALCSLSDFEKELLPMPLQGPGMTYSGIGKEKVRGRACVKESFGFRNPEDISKEESIRERGDFMKDFFQDCSNLMHQLLQCLSLALNLGPQDALSQHHTNLPFTLDLIHYPAISINSLRSDECVRCPAHSDFGILTLLFQDNTGGFEIADMSSTTKETSAGVERTARFLHIDPIPGTIVVNVGYLLMRWSNGRWRSAVHRVSEPPSKRESEEVLELPGGKSIRGEGHGAERICPERYSVAFFSTPDHETMVDALPGCWSEEVPKKWEPINVGEYISRKRKAVYS